MLFLARCRTGDSSFDPDRAPASLGLFAGASAPFERQGDFLLSQIDSSARASTPGGKRPSWRAPRSPSGFPVLFHGWIDNADALAHELGVRHSDAARLYGAAVEAWGDQADRQIIGSYSAAVLLPDNGVRLARSPWSNHTLFYYRDEQALFVSSITRPIFASGVRRELDLDAVGRSLAMEMPGDTECVFQGIRQVPQGSVLTVSDGGERIDRWYDPNAIPLLRLESDEAYVEAANAMLSEAVAAALRGTQNRCISLSGGLDSAIVTDEILRQLPEPECLKSFTFRPHTDWDGKVKASGFGDDWPYVQAYAAMHPRLDAIAVTNEGIGYDDHAEQLWMAGEFGHPAYVLGGVYHGINSAARDAGCSWMLNAAMGNRTFSSAAPWAGAEFFRTGRWRQLWRLAGSVNARNRPWGVFKQGILPCLPEAARERIEKALRDWKDDGPGGNPLLAADGPLARFRDPSRIARFTGRAGMGADRAQAIRDHYDGAGSGGAGGMAIEQVFGIRQRDVTAYRPLIELCNAMPTDQFVRDGERRFLARRMARGRMPEAQRTNRLYGQHNVDWRARLTPQREAMARDIERLAGHPDLGPMFDTDRMRAMVKDWPNQTPDNPAALALFRFYLPSALYMARYVDAMTGRNEP